MPVDLLRAAYLQSLLTHRILTDVESRSLYRTACHATKNSFHASKYEDFILECSTDMGRLGLEIRRMIDQETGKVMIGLVNTKSDDISQLPSTFTAPELSYIKALIEQIFTAPGEAFSVTTMKALSLSGQMKPAMTKKAVEELLNSLQRKDWIERSESGRLSLSTRTILELQTYLRQAFEEYVLQCSVCKDIVTKGFVCSTDGCDGAVHRPCGRTLQGHCLECKETWEPQPVGEASGGRQRGRPSRDDDNDEAEEEDELEATQQPARGASRANGSRNKRASNGRASNANGKRRRTSRAQDDDEEEEETEMTEEEEEDEEQSERSDTEQGSEATSRPAQRRRSTNGTASRAASGRSRRGGGAAFVDDEAGDGQDEEDESD